MRKSAIALTAFISLAMAGTCLAQRSTGETVDDGVLVSSTKTELLKVAPNVASAINVGAHSGRVLLIGFVDSDKQKSEALAAARGVKGQTAVIDGLVVMPGTRSIGTTIDDQAMQTKVKTAITSGENWEKGLAINTEAKNGEVLLGGFVPKASQRDAAGKAAAGVAGVKKVHNFVQVK
jgi:osmotically-inducible protein OsmY